MANRVRTVFANLSWLMISQIITSVCAFIWTILTARYLGPADYGFFGTTTSLAAMLAVLADFGVTTYIVRAISTDMEMEDKYLNNALSLKLFLGIFYMFVVFVACLIYGFDNYMLIICMLFGFESLIKSFHNMFFSSFQAHEKMKYQAIANTILNVLTLVFIVIVTFTDYALTGITFAYIFANFITLAYIYWAIKKHIISPKFSWDLQFYKVLIKAGFPFALTGIFYTIYYSIDIIMLTKFVGAYATGLYNSAYKLINVLSLFYAIYTAVVFPVMSKLFKSERDMMKLSFVKSVKYLLLITVPIAVATFFYGADIINIYGTEYAEAGDVLKILIWTICFLFVNGACSLVLNASHCETSVTKIYSIAAAFNVVLNLFMIPTYSVYGASIATVISEVLILILELYMLSKINQLPDKSLIYDVIKIAFASGVMGLVLDVFNLSLLFAIPVGIIVYFAVILLVRTFDDDDKLIIHQVIGR